jgi:hypothetical protein
MMRRLLPMAAFALLFSIALPLCAQQQQAASKPTKSLAQRIASLRLGWGKADASESQEGAGVGDTSIIGGESAEIPEVPPAQPAPLKVASLPQPTPRAGSVPRLAANPTTNSGLPRVNPYNLMPPDLGAPANSANNSKTTTPSAPNTSPGGSARDRMLRDLQQQTAAPTTTPGPLMPMPAPKAPASAKVSKSIASEVAAELAKQNDQFAPPQTSPKPEALPAPTTDDRYAAPASQPQLQINAAPNASPRLVIDSGDSSAKSPPSSLSKPLAVTTNDSPEESFRPAAAPMKQSVKQSPTSDLLFTQQAPMLVSRVTGPAQIVIGREAAYRVTIANRGDANADKLIAKIIAPQGAEIVGTTASVGAVTRPNIGIDPGRIEWRMERLASGKLETLDLVLVATSGKPIELGVSFEHAPVGSRTLVEVQEPKLELALSGPEEVQFAKPQLYRLTLTNPGTGAAENIVIKLTPPGAAASAPITHKLGDLAAGATKSVEIELTARDPGQLAMHATATATGGLKASAEKALFCRRAELVVDWRGPQQKYAGSSASYFFRVRNPGTAIAEQVDFRVELPSGFEFTSASEGQTYDAASNTVTWKVGSLRPGDDHYMELQGVVRQAGACNLKIAATTADGITTASTNAATDVIAVADLKLDVLDPKGPIAVGEEAVYEIRVRNRGANAASDVRVVALFSAGIEPLRVEGAQNTMADGRVAFGAIGSLAAGREVVYRIVAKAHDAGTHLFRAEVLCKDLDIKLAAEETTRFFADDAQVEGVSQAAAERFASPK